MFLISIETREKSEQINELVMKNFGKTYLWIGGYVLPNSDPLKFLWIRSGQVLNYAFWGSVYPQPIISNNNPKYCIQIGLYNMKWLNYNCENKVGFICESLPPSSIIENNEIKEMEKKLQDLQQQLEDQQKLAENLTMKIKQYQLKQQVLEQNKLLIDNDLEDCKDIKSKYYLLNENFIKKQFQLEEQQQKQLQTVQETLQKLQIYQNPEKNENKIHEIVHEQITEKNKKDRNIIFNFHTNFQANDHKKP